MTPVFADTSFYIAAVNPRDAHHAAAVRLAQALAAPVINTEFVLIECGNLLSRSDDRAAFLALVDSIQHGRRTTVLASSPALFEAGLALRDKNWSMTDCISFAVMREREVVDALTADHHFEQAGYHALMLRTDAPEQP